MKAKVVVVGIAVGAIALTACSDGSVKGDRDDVKYSKAVYTTATRTVNEYRRQCTAKMKRTKHTSGTGKNKRTWYTNDSYQDCKNVKTGSHLKTYKKLVSAAKYCVELDNVGGDKDKDDVWYNVSSGTYYSALGKREGASMKFTYNHKGC